MPLISASAPSSSQSSWSVPWAICVGRERVESGEAGQAGRPLVELRVELHRARAERIEAGVDRVVELGQVDVVADDLRLVELRQGRRRRPTGGRGHAVEGVLRRVRDLAAAAPRARLLEERRLEPGAGDAHRGPPRPRRRAGSRRRPRRRPADGPSGPPRAPPRTGRSSSCGGDLGRAHEQAVGERRIVGLGLGQGEPGEARRARAGGGGPPARRARGRRTR